MALPGTAHEQEAGASSWSARFFYATSTTKQIKDHLNAILHRDLDAFTLESDSVKNTRHLDQPLSIDYDVTAPGYAQEAGTLLLVRPRVLGSVENKLESKMRQYPISFSNEGTWSDSIKIMLPPGYKVDDLPDPVHVDLGFADYTSDVKAEGTCCTTRGST